MNFTYDYYNKVELPVIILQNQNGDNIGSLGYAHNVKLKLRYNDCSEVSFEYPQKVEGISTPYYDLIKSKKHINIPNIGVFVLKDVQIESDGIKECKICQGYSLEFELSSKDIIDLDGTYPLYDVLNPSQSILGMVTLLSPSWSIGDIDVSLIGTYRTFKTSKQKILNFLGNDVQKAFECIFFYNTFTKTISCKSIANLKDNNSIFMSFDNLLKTVKVQEQSEQIITALSVTGGNGLDIHSVNPLGTNIIYDFTNYLNVNDMKQDLINAITSWNIKVNSLQPSYSDYLTQLKNNYDLLTTKQDELKALQETLDGYIDVQQARIQATQDISSINAQIINQNALITGKNNEIASVNNTINSLNINLNNISSQLSFVNNFTSAQLKELDSYIYSDGIQSNNFTQTDSMSNSEIQSQSQQLYNYGKNLLSRVSKMRLTFNVESANFLFLKEYQNWCSQLQLGSYINIQIRDGYVVQPMLIGLELDWSSENSFIMEFSSRTRSDNPAFYFDDTISSAISSATTLDANLYQYSDWQNNKNIVSDFMTSSLDASKNAIISSNNQDVLFDSHGIRGRKFDTVTGQFSAEQMWLSNNSLCFTKDSWNTASLALGIISNPSGIGSSYGLIADVLVGKMVASNSLIISNANNTFTVNASGATLTNATMTIQNSYNSIKLDPTNGIKVTNLQTSSDVFYLDTSGNINVSGILNAKDLKINGASVLTSSNKISGNYIDGDTVVAGSLKVNASITSPIINGGQIIGTTFNNGNGTFTVNSSGQVTASNIDITGGSISVSSNVYLGDTLYVGRSTGSVVRGITFNGNLGHLNAYNTTLELGATSHLSLYSGGSIDFSCTSISGLNGKVVRPEAGQNISLTTTSTGLNVRVDGVTVGNIAWS